MTGDDRLERIRALLPDTWRLGAELESPEPAPEDDDDAEPFDDATEMHHSPETAQ